MDPSETDPALGPTPTGLRARFVGLRDLTAHSLESVERRRFQLWVLSAILLVSLSLGFAVVTIWPQVRAPSLINPSVLRVGIVLLAVAFCAYAFEKELQLRRLSKLLLDEQVMTAALTGRLREVTLLLDAGRAMNSVLELPPVLETILAGSLEMIGGASGSIMLLEGDELVCAAVHGNEAARGSRVRIGEGIAGRVAAEREPLLIDGRDEVGRRRTQPVDSAMSVPLLHRDEVLGVLNVNADPDRTFSEFDLRALSMFAEQAASAIANARLYATEQRRVEELIELDRMKRDFVATVSHELRTPLTSIVAAAKTAKRPGTEGHQDEFWEIVERQADRLSGTVEDILEAAKLDERREHPESFRSAADVAAMTRMAASDFAVAGRMIEVDAPSSAVAHVDPHAIRRVLDNLIDNALKHGRAPVRVEVMEEDDRIDVTVLDAGPGVPASCREQIFERFSRLERDRENPGIGLGLPIVRALVRGSGGEITVGDAVGGGAAFTVSLPKERAIEATG